jgi:hypothetical protein
VGQCEVAQPAGPSPPIMERNNHVKTHTSVEEELIAERRRIDFVDAFVEPFRRWIGTVGVWDSRVYSYEEVCEP